VETRKEAAKMSSGDIVEFKQEGAAIINGGMVKLTKYLEGDGFEFCVKEYMKIYRSVYKMCTQKAPHNYPQEVYDKYRELIEEYISWKVLPALEVEVEGHDDELMLRKVVKIWENYESMLRFLSNMFYYLDRYFVPKHSLPALREVGMKCFHELVYHKISVALKNAVIKVMNREREGEQIDRALLKSGVNIFVMNGMDFYKSDYEVPMLEETCSYYSKKAASWVSEISCPQYMLKAEQCLIHEGDIVKEYLHSGSVESLLEKVRNELISSQKTYLLENEQSGCYALLRDNKRDELFRMYTLFCLIPEGLESLANTFQQYVTRQGLTFVEVANDDDAYQFVENVVRLHHRFHSLLMSVFETNPIFQKALDNAFMFIYNHEIGGRTSAEFFATFYDNLLRTHGGNIWKAVELKASLLDYLGDKRSFEDFCIKKLADRLLLDKCSTVDNENKLLSHLKRELGQNFISRMESMLEDFVIAGNDKGKFKVYLDSSNINVGMDVSVSEFNCRLWPSYKSCQLNLPPKMARSIELYKEYYHNKHEGKRKPTWMYSLGTCNVMVNFEQKPIELKVSTYQAAVILLLDESGRLSYEQIKSQLNLGDEDIASVLHSLCEDYEILSKDPITQTLTPTDYFQLNSKFTHCLNSIKIPFQRPQERNKQPITDVDTERRASVQAALVRVMKRNKVLPRQQLMTATVEELAKYFTPRVDIMELELKWLINQGYLAGRLEASDEEGYLAGRVEGSDEEENQGSDDIKYVE